MMKIENIYYVKHFIYVKSTFTPLEGLDILLSLVEISGSSHDNF